MNARPANAQVIALTANSLANLAHFRAPLFAGLSDAGFQTLAIAPDDGIGAAPGDGRIIVPMDRGGTNPVRDLATLAAYVRCFRVKRPRAVLSFTPKANIWAGIASRLTGIPFFPNISGLGTAFLAGGLVRHIQLWLYKRALAHAGAVFFQNSDDLQAFVDDGLVRTDQARLLPGSGIDLDHFSPQPMPANAISHFLFIGRLLTDKGVRELMDAARQLRREGVPFALTVIGDVDPGNPSSVTTREIDGWRSEELATFAGQQGDVRPFIAACDAVVLPSYREGLPRSLLEAAASARPMIATDVPGCREVVIAGETGLLCGARDAGSLATAIRSFCSLSGEDRDVLGRSARLLAEQRFDQRLVVQHYLDALAGIGVGSASRSI